MWKFKKTNYIYLFWRFIILWWNIYFKRTSPGFMGGRVTIGWIRNTYVKMLTLKKSSRSLDLLYSAVFCRWFSCPHTQKRHAFWPSIMIQNYQILIMQTGEVSYCLHKDQPFIYFKPAACSLFSQNCFHCTHSLQRLVSKIWSSTQQYTSLSGKNKPNILSISIQTERRESLSPEVMFEVEVSLYLFVFHALQRLRLER